MSKSKTKLFTFLAIIVVLVSAIVFIIVQKNTKTLLSSYDNELKRAMSYEQFTAGDESVEGTDNVKFSTFFLRDLDGDGYAEKLKGTCKEVGSQDTLYMEINVQTEGYLKDAKIQINGKNFYMETALPKDNELKENYIGNNVKKIEFEQLNNGTQKLLTGIVKSGDYSSSSSKYSAIGNNINNYSRNDNSIVLTGTYVTEDGTEIPITKEINLNVDWYGTTRTSIYSTYQTYRDIENRINEEGEKITLDFYISTQETNYELNISSNYVEATIPQLNGYNPISVRMTSGNGEFAYDETTRKITITKHSVTDDNGNITSSLSRYGSNKIQVVYPLEAFTSLEEDSVSISVPISTYYEGYNNPNPEFQNPYRSNIARTTIIASYTKPVGTVASLYITVGRYISSPTWRYMISKRKPIRLYNETSSEEKDDFYTVRWEASTGTDGESTGMVLKETKNGEDQKTDTFIKNNSTQVSMEEVTTNVGIYFSNPTSLLGNNGEIKIFNEDTDELIHTFNSSDWTSYNSNNPYKYETPVKHIRIETSATKANSYITVYNIKELDDEKIVDTYTREEFNNLQYIRSNLTMYLGEKYIGSRTHQANYEAPYSLANISIDKQTVSTQKTIKGLIININAVADETINQEKWTNGTFLIKVPNEILDVKINEVLVNSLLVNLDSYEIVDNSSGKFIKIKTSNVNPDIYRISIDVDITPDPRIATVTKYFELYAINEGCEDYYYSSNDKYDVDEDNNNSEKVNYRSTKISLVAPNTMLTNQTLTDFDGGGTIIVSPKIADLKPVYGNNDLEKQIIKIGAQIKNNYSSTIDEVIMIGKIPFEGNTYVVSGGSLESRFSTIMVDTGIEVPTRLQGKVTVYYSENENPSNDLTDVSNGWTLAENVSDWTKIRTWAVDFGDTVLNKGDEFIFYYNVEVPFGVELNKESFSHHGLFFSLNTPEGRYRTQTEPNKIGIRIADKYDLIVKKYQKNVDKTIEEATYRISKLDDEGNIEISQTAKTDENGLIRMTNLYAENVYEIKEIQTPNDYDLNEDAIKIIGHVNRETGALSIEKLAGETRDEIQVTKNEGEDYIAHVNVEDEAKAKLKIVKYEQGTETKVSGARYTITGYGLPDAGKIIRTKANGEADLSGLKVGEEYTIQESNPAEGYYLNSDIIKFTIVNNNGTYEVNISQGSTRGTNVTQVDDLPSVQIEVEDEKIPTYNLEILKLSKGENTPLAEIEFDIYKENRLVGVYKTDENGKIVIPGLYQYEDSKNVDQTYVLKESKTIDGYSRVKDIEFSVKKVDSTLVLTSDSNAIVENIGTDTKVSITVEDPKTFELKKIDGETGALLPNTKFAIYNLDNGDGDAAVPAVDGKGRILGQPIEINGEQYYYLETDENGKITADLPEGLYKAVELAPNDEKYDISNKSKVTYRFGVGQSLYGDEISLEWGENIGGTGEDNMNCTLATNDGGIVFGGWYLSPQIFIDNEEVIDTLMGNDDGIMVKYDRNGLLEWVKRIGGENRDGVDKLANASDGGLFVGINAGSTYIDFGNNVILEKDSEGSRTAIVKYSSTGDAEWVKSYSEASSDIATLVGTRDGGYLIGDLSGTVFRCNSSGQTIWRENTGSDAKINDKIETADGGFLIGKNGSIKKYSSTGSLQWTKSTTGNVKSIKETTDGGFIFVTSNGNIVKYSQNGTLTWEKTTSSDLSGIVETEDSGFLIVGHFSGTLNLSDNIRLTSKGGSDGFVAKLDSSGNAVFGTTIGGTAAESLMGVTANKNGGYFVCGETSSTNVKVGDVQISNSYGDKDLLVVQFSDFYNIPEQSEIIASNYRKQYKITTDVKELNGVKGGTISGEDLLPYENVKHGDNSQKIIKMIPNHDYEILEITINGESYDFEAGADGSVTLPSFENMTENKHVVVTYVLKDNKITINKVDKDTGERLTDIEFKLDQIEERTDPINSEILGNITENGTKYYINNDYEVTSTALKPKVNNGTYYFAEKDTTLVPTNSKTYRSENNLGTTGVSNSVANSYFPIDLENLQGDYVVVVNARVSSESGYDYGYLTITNNTTAPLFNVETGRFMYKSGVASDSDYKSTLLEGGNTYYLHLGYRKDGSNDSNEDQVVINSIKVYKANVERYSFTTNNGVYESTNAGKNNRVCNSFIPIDLTNYTGKYNIKVNAEISTQSGDYGYVTINQERTAPNYNNSSGRIVYITDIKSAKDYTYEVDGGYQYYLHLGYYKDGTTNTKGDDIFKVKNIRVELSGSQLYHTTVKTNSNGQAITQIPFGKYSITELNTLEMYKELEHPIEIEFRSDDGAQHVFTIENEQKAKLIVHHYIKGTETKLADDEVYYGDIDENYTTAPKLDIEKYSLEKDNNDEYIIPTNATGQYKEEDTIVTYFYVQMPAMIRVNHYIEGTENPVPLNDGNYAPQVIKNGQIGENYTTEAISPDNLEPGYELVEVPDNSTGEFEEDTIIVNYFYKLKSCRITTDVDEYDQTNILGETEHIRGGDILGEDETPYELVKYGENSKKDIIITPEENYEVKAITINGNDLPFTVQTDGSVVLAKFINVTEDKHIVVRLGKKLSQVIVHHYIEGTTTKVPSKYGGEVQDVTTTGAIGNPYVTKPTDEITGRYELVATPENASGTFANNTIEVIYYYKEIPAKVIVNHYVVDTTTPVPLKDGGNAEQETINGYVTKDYTSNKLDTIDDNYTYVSDTGNTSGQMTKEDITVNYYYAPKAYAKVNYIAINSNDTETILESVDYQGLDKESYTSHSKDFEGYKLVEKPTEETKNLDKDNLTVFNYYYRKNTGLLEKHIDLYSDEILLNESQEKNVGDEYEINSRTFNGYDIATNKKYYEKQIKDNPDILTENGVDSLEGLLNKLDLEADDPYIPKNYKGTMREETVEVKYYYMKKAKVIVKYKDKITEEPIHTDTPIDGHEKDPYKTDPLDIDDYDLTEAPEYMPTNTKGEMTPETIIVTYYYENKTEVKVNHIYILDDTLIDSGRTEGHVKDFYKAEELDNEKYPSYRIVTNKEYYDYAVKKDNSILVDNNVETVDKLLAKLKLSEYDPYIPENYKGEMTKDTIVVNYYYKKTAPVIIKYIDEDTGKELTDPEEELKTVGDSYTTDSKDFDKYTLVEERIPENAEGVVDEDGIEVIYYYRKEKKSIQNEEKVDSPQTGDTTLVIASGMIIIFLLLNIFDKINIRKKSTKTTSIIK